MTNEERELMLSILKERDSLKEYKRLLWEQNTKLLEEKESGQWDKNCKDLLEARAENAVLTKELEELKRER